MSKQETSCSQIQMMRKNLRSLRQSREWSIEELAARSNLPADTLRAIEQGGDFNMGCLKVLCDLYGIEPVDLFRPRQF